MGALTRLTEWFVGQQYWSIQTFGAWLTRYAQELLLYVPGLSVGPLTEWDPMGFPGMYRPPNAGETEGELYLSNDRSPPMLFVWQGGFWWRCDLKAPETP